MHHLPVAYRVMANLRTRSSRLQPVQSVLADGEPRGRKDRGPFENLLTACLDRVGESCWHVESKLSRAGRAVARDDAIVPPLHHTGAELVSEPGRVDQQRRRTYVLRLPRI